MKRSILITGTYRPIRQAGKIIATTYTYDIGIFATDKEGGLEVITDKEITCSGYASLWQAVTEIVAAYYNDHKYKDGGYTAFMERLREAA